MRVAVIGLGRVGLPTACYFARLGHQVTGYDSDTALRARLAWGENPLSWEPGVYEWLPSVKYVPTLEASLRDVTCVYVIVPTPQRGSGLSAEYVKEVCGKIYDFGYRGWIVVGSTLDPRTVVEVCVTPNVLYNPPLIRLGHVIEDLAYPTVALLGMSVSAGLKVLRELWGWSEGDSRAPKQVVGDPLSIAVAKLAINVSLSARIAWANEIDLTCRELGASTEKVLEAVGSDARIGSAYLKPGWSPAGPCLPRDLDVWCSFGVSPLAVSTKVGHGKARQRIIRSTMDWLEPCMGPSRVGAKPVVGVLGLVYNPGAADTTLSQGMAIVDACIGRGWPVLGYDPMGGDIVSGVQCETPLTLAAVLEESDVIVIAAPWKEFDKVERMMQFERVLRLGGTIR